MQANGHEFLSGTGAIFLLLCGKCADTFWLPGAVERR